MATKHGDPDRNNPATAPPPPPPLPLAIAPQPPPQQQQEHVPSPQQQQKPKTFLLTSAVTPLGFALARHLLLADGRCSGNRVAACSPRAQLSSPLLATLRTLAAAAAGADDADDADGRVIVLELDPVVPSTVQAAMAQAAAQFGGRLDVVVHTGVGTEVGALEELAVATGPHATPHVTRQFEHGYYGRVAVVRAALALMRRQRGGHVVVVTGLTGAMGTPGLALRCAADHAIEGLLEALAFEVAPFAVRVSIVQPSVEVAVWGCGPVATAAPLAAYDAVHRVRAVRALAANPDLALAAHASPDLADTVRVIAAIAGSDNPPGRVTVGAHAVDAVRERLKTLSEELEEYLDASLAADILAPPGVGGTGGRTRPVGVDIDE